MWPMDLVSLRTGLGLTQAEFAERVGSTAAYIGHLETGFRKPSLKLAMRIEQATGAKGFVDAVEAEKREAARDAIAPAERAA